ncbi:hypothetical protein, partial [Pseudomonas aeruginosa]|uniref:hypothetical protein n=13 Tax=Gammaproteobacteria TaxID=1236 RepID=UPI001ABC9428
MKTFARLAAGLCICAIASQANAWSQPTHKNIVKDALAFMNSSYATEEMRQAYRFYVSAAGSEAQAGEILGQAAFDVDDFKDTRLGGWWVGYEHAPLWGAASGIVNYTSYWHFLNLARDGDSHGNPHGGYDYRYHKVDGGIADVDWYAMVYLYNRELKREDFDTTEAHYRQGTRSDWQEHYGDFQTAAFQPIDNLATYWFEQFPRRAFAADHRLCPACHRRRGPAAPCVDHLGQRPFQLGRLGRRPLRQREAQRPGGGGQPGGALRPEQEHPRPAHPDRPGRLRAPRAALRHQLRDAPAGGEGADSRVHRPDRHRTDQGRQQLRCTDCSLIAPGAGVAH